MCDARRVTSEPAVPAESGTAPDMAALAKVVARQRAELDRLQDQAAASAVLERAKGALMALTGCGAEAAYEELLARSKTADHTLMEECWITLGALESRPDPADAEPGAPAPEDPAPAAARPGPAETGADVPYGDGGSGVLAVFGRALVRVGTSRDLAQCLLDHVAVPVGAAAVVIYRRLPSGGLELTGHAGVDDAFADLWRHVPPVSGVAARHALETREELWLEDLAEDSKRYVPIGGPDGPWRTRAWLPVLQGDTADAVIGVLRDRDGPFPRTSGSCCAE